MTGSAAFVVAMRNRSAAERLRRHCRPAATSNRAASSPSSSRLRPWRALASVAFDVAAMVESTAAATKETRKTRTNAGAAAAAKEDAAAASLRPDETTGAGGAQEETRRSWDAFLEASEREVRAMAEVTKAGGKKEEVTHRQWRRPAMATSPAAFYNGFSPSQRERNCQSDVSAD